MVELPLRGNNHGGHSAGGGCGRSGGGGSGDRRVCDLDGAVWDADFAGFVADGAVACGGVCSGAGRFHSEEDGVEEAVGGGAVTE